MRVADLSVALAGVRYDPCVKPFLDDGDVTVYEGDCVEVMAEVPAESVDAVVCDPPYALAFMGRGWDAYGPREFQAWCEIWAREALRVLRPGGHLLAFGGTRTFHRLTCGIEDAGFEIRDCLSWLYGSGFPKSMDVSKAIDRAAGAEREVVGTKLGQPGYSLTDGNGDHRTYSRGLGNTGTGEAECAVTAPATDAAREWEGWGTALKPGWEPIVLARKPLAGTVAANVLAHGTGALNIDGCRIGTHGYTQEEWTAKGASRPTGTTYGTHRPSDTPLPAGRWPANVVLDEAAAQALDAQTGDLHHQDPATRASKSTATGVTAFTTRTGSPEYADRGGPSRFFYTAKASRKDRNTNGVNNTHPTVKPTALMRWLIRMVCPVDGVILDPFGGSGTTGVAARAEGVKCIMVEREAEYLSIIAGRLRALTLT